MAWGIAGGGLVGALVGILYLLWQERLRKQQMAIFKDTIAKARTAGFAEGIRSVRRGALSERERPASIEGLMDCRSLLLAEALSERERAASIEGLTDCRRLLLAEALDAPPVLTPTPTTGRPEESETRI